MWGFTFMINGFSGTMTDNLAHKKNFFNGKIADSLCFLGTSGLSLPQQKCGISFFTLLIICNS